MIRKEDKRSKRRDYSFCDLTYAYARGGGITTYIKGKAQYYRQHKLHHIIITPRTDDGRTTKVEKDGLQTLYRVPARKIMIESLPYYFFRSYSDIAKIIQKERPSLLEIGDSFTTFFYGRKLHRLMHQWQGKVDVFVHERLDNFYRQVLSVERGSAVLRFFKRLIAGFLTELLLRRFLGSADAVIANSLFSAQEAKSHTIKPVYTLALGIEVERYYQATRDEKLYAELSDNGTKKVLLHVGRLEKDKKIDLLVEFAQKLDPKKYVLVVIGDGKYKEQLAASPAVKALGYFQQDQILRYLMCADLGILVNNIEPFGLVGLEMMAAGLPLLAPHTGGLSSFITKDFAWLLPYNASAYSKALQEWSSLTAAQQQKLREASRRESEQYTTAKMGSRLMELYSTILAEPKQWP
jgi:glycosyltransferase involved in cell wall biosynthesis